MWKGKQNRSTVFDALFIHFTGAFERPFFCTI
nr:MAG TPA: hypothetical protein [Caudoviricetes sp.]